jgi:hypothetical protein
MGMPGSSFLIIGDRQWHAPPEHEHVSGVTVGMPGSSFLIIGDRQWHAPPEHGHVSRVTMGVKTN